ncbi:MAG: FliM/FliN family flagellar motor switch protein, partial [Deltaproteobacteria bacterium]|nr:FliM/FliN family flagellar motor switch protein [Deltaproteobacteria bacterium]
HLDKEEFEKSVPSEKGEIAVKGGDFVDEAVHMSEDMPVKLVAVLGKKNILLKDLLRLKVGQSIDLERAPNEFVDLMANGKLVARGELVEIDGKLGVRIIKMLK